MDDIQACESHGNNLLIIGADIGLDAAIKPILIKEGVYDKFCDNDTDRDASKQSGRSCLRQDLQVCMLIRARLRRI